MILKDKTKNLKLLEKLFKVETDNRQFANNMNSYHHQTLINFPLLSKLINTKRMNLPVTALLMLVNMSF